MHVHVRVGFAYLIVEIRLVDTFVLVFQSKQYIFDLRDEWIIYHNHICISRCDLRPCMYIRVGIMYACACIAGLL